MIEWITNNIGTIIVGLIVLAIITAVVIGMIRKKKNGKSTCGCGCANCPLSGDCHKK